MSTEGQDLALEQAISESCSFQGRFAHSLDRKRRLIIPSVWRAVIPAPRSLYVLQDFDRPCLRVFPGPVWDRRMAPMRNLPLSDAEARSFVRELGLRSDVVIWDAQGRIRIRDAVLDAVGLVDQIVLVGTLDTFELWAPDAMTAQPSLDTARFTQLAAQYKL